MTDSASTCRTPASQPLMACQECDLLQRIPPLPIGGKALCARCGYSLAARPTDPLQIPLALSLTAAIVFVVANVTPMIGLSAVGRHASTTIVGGAWQLWHEGEKIAAAIVMFCGVIAPAFFMVLMLAVLITARRLQRARLPHWVGEILRWSLHMQPWSMYDVMSLGVLVALIKIAQLASVDPGIGMYAMGLLAVLVPAIMVSFDAREIWKLVDWETGKEASTQAVDQASLAGGGR
ncbi:paraquat-inducible protein A [Candidatus Accumulibacter sp. ACC012]|uniref:paraquat-inducible protein A n=1 Tax=Candidatus Accumulibacter sp. ACC012 TaxID=2823332 RepID=UPI0025B83BF6|nr:paraquat-inducible protein A [Candidatus Accumulibacter sp. ACC012]